MNYCKIGQLATMILQCQSQMLEEETVSKQGLADCSVNHKFANGQLPTDDIIISCSIQNCCLFHSGNDLLASHSIDMFLYVLCMYMYKQHHIGDCNFKFTDYNKRRQT